MSKPARKSVVIVGCGNLAWHMSQHLLATGSFDVDIYNHTKNPALLAFKKSGVKVHSSLAQITRTASVYIICTTDESVPAVALKIKPSGTSALVLHSSGSLSSEVLMRHKNSAVLYPLQTFSKKDKVDWFVVPLLVTGNSTRSQEEALQFARVFSPIIVAASNEERKRTHLAAVVANNFVNAMYAEAFRIAGPNSKYLLPLIRKTASKVEAMAPSDAQTGPAKRNDVMIMMDQLDQLDDPELKKLYVLVSRLIMTQEGREIVPAKKARKTPRK